jgi:transglutaminase-like putative cysteine protease
MGIPPGHGRKCFACETFTCKTFAMTPDPAWLRPSRFADSEHPDVIAFAREACSGATTPKEQAKLLFRAVRERLRYDPYAFTTNPDDYLASAILRRERTFCIPKAILLAAAARAVGIPARLGFADVRNHLSSEKLLRRMGSDLFVFHGYTELWIDGRPLKATPAFNAGLCERFGVAPLELDGETDALLQPFDNAGRKYMEYVTDRGVFIDLPFDAMLAAFDEAYGKKDPIAASVGGDRHDEAFH